MSMLSPQILYSIFRPFGLFKENTTPEAARTSSIKPISPTSTTKQQHTDTKSNTIENKHIQQITLRQTKLEESRRIVHNLNQITKEYFVNEVDICKNGVERAFLRSVKNVSNNYAIALKQMANQIKIINDDADSFYNSIKIIASSMFSKDINNGRIATFYAFSGVLYKQITEENRNLDLLDSIDRNLNEFGCNEITEYIINNGGWITYSEYFPEINATEKFVVKSGCALLMFNLATLTLVSALKSLSTK